MEIVGRALGGVSHTHTHIHNLKRSHEARKVETTITKRRGSARGDGARSHRSGTRRMLMNRRLREKEYVGREREKEREKGEEDRARSSAHRAKVHNEERKDGEDVVKRTAG